MKQQQSAQPDVNCSAHQQPSSSFHGLNQQPTSQGVNKQIGNTQANHLQYYDDSTIYAQQHLGPSWHQNHPTFPSSSLSQNKIQFNPINSQQIGQQQYTNAVHQNPTVFYNGQNNLQPQRSQMPQYGQFIRSVANYQHIYSNQGCFVNATNNAHQQITPSSHQHQFYNGQNNASYHQPLRSHMPPTADNSLFSII